MLTVKNNNITVVRGETSMLKYTAVRRNGMPYILAPRVSGVSELKDRRDYAILAFTVKTSAYGDIVLAKYFDLEAPPMYDGVTDYSDGGLHKFVTSEIVTVSDLSDVVDFDKVYNIESTNSYLTRIKKHDGTSEIKCYQFKLAIPFTWTELEKLESKEYIYDLTLYYGQLTDTELAAINGEDVITNEFPLQQNDYLVKIPLVKVHKFIVEESNNV